ncbi:MAG: hypothetical protein QMD23_03785 [Candidatus Bathyarchaeia archaeon]|nr:hypothetical protein [Candidatus Bathyarchaeia archaeon]
MEESNITAKVKKLVEKYGWIVIILLLIALIVSVIAFFRERNKNKGVK